MDHSHSESDVSLSPSQILDRLHRLRQLQILQRGKLQQHRLQYQNSPEITSSITEIVSHFSDSTSYNTFRSLLQSTQDTQNEGLSKTKENLSNVIDGVSVLNISAESELYPNSPTVTRSSNSVRISNDNIQSTFSNVESKLTKKQISLDDMPILSPKKDFETLLTEKLKNDKNLEKEKKVVIVNSKKNIKKPFLKRGEGTARFGIQKANLVIQNTKSLPWRKENTILNSKPKTNSEVLNSKPKSNSEVLNSKPKTNSEVLNSKPKTNSEVLNKNDRKLTANEVSNNNKKITRNSVIKINIEPLKNKNGKQMEVIEPLTKPQTKNLEVNKQLQSHINNLMPEKGESTSVTLKADECIPKDKGKTWAAVLTKEQDDFLRKLKQSDYYKNFGSPAKSIVSDVSCDEDSSRLKQEKEVAEQNLFELLENKVSHESFNIHNSFFSRFLRNNNLECSGESTPLIMQKYLSKNPNLLHIFPEVQQRLRNDSSHDCDTETCNSEYTEFSENCSTFSSCCSCKTVTQGNLDETCNAKHLTNQKGVIEKVQDSQNSAQNYEEKKGQSDNVTVENETINANMMEMNSKLIATGELLRDRLKELEDEIETFRKENANLAKMREEVDLERQKFYEEKTMFEQKFNEEKILSEYYLAEEKEKLNKQKQMYERYVRDMRGRLNKKEKDEVITLKNEIHNLKEEIKLKDAKSTSTIARLRNQLKLMDKDKKNLEEEIDKLKKENRRIQHSNEMTRRLTNIKYLEQINKKLTNMASKDSRSEVDVDSNIKYKAFEIERQSRGKKAQHLSRGPKQRAKSVPNLHVTSRYAKYFSQKDSLSERERNSLENNLKNLSENISNIKHNICEDSDISDNCSESEDENKLEKIYNDRFKSLSPASSTKSFSLYDHVNKTSEKSMHSNDFFIQKSNNGSQKSTISELADSRAALKSISSNRLINDSKSSLNSTNENDVILNYEQNSNRTKSPVSILSNRSSSSLKCGTVINKEKYLDTLAPSPEPQSSKTSLTKTKLSPTEITRPDGSKELRFPNGNIKLVAADGKYSKFIYYNGDIKENFYDEGRIKYYYAETKTYHTTHPDGLEVLEFPDGQVEKRYKDGSSEIRLPNGSIRYYDPKNEHVREEWRFPDGAALTVSANGEQRIVFANGQVEVHAKDHKRREYPDGTVKLVYNDGTSETRYASGRVRIKDKHGNLIMDSAPG